MKHILVALLSLCGMERIYSQEFKWDRTLNVYVSPSISTRFIGQINPDFGARYTADKLRDSFSKHDISSNYLNYGVSMTIHKNSRTAFEVGIGLNTTGFTRQKTGNMFNYQPHPDLSLYANMVEGPTQILNYNFKYQYLSFDFRYHGRIDGVGLMIKNTKIWYFAGLSPSILIDEALNIYTQGFTLAEGNDLNLTDYTALTDDFSGRTIINKVHGNKFNLMANVGFKFDYALTETLHLMAQPKAVMPLIASANGVQQVWCPWLGLDAGIIWPLR